MDDPIEALLEYWRRLDQLKRDCFITTASKEGLLNICKLIGIDPTEELTHVQDP